MKREDIVIVVTDSGEHIIGERIEQATHTVEIDGGVSTELWSITLNKPVSMMPDPTPGAGRGRILFIPYLQFTDLTSVPFPGHSVRHVLGEVKEDLRNNYAQQFGDGLQIPKQGLILG